MGSPSSGPKSTTSHLRVMFFRTYLEEPPTCLNRNPITGMATLLHPRITPLPRCRNINLLSIDYAFRPRLRYRLTLGGLPFPRKPWAFGEQVSHLLYRYLCQHMLLRLLQHPSRDTFIGYHNTPLPLLAKSMASVTCLSPVEFSAQKRLTSELLRFL